MPVVIAVLDSISARPLGYIQSVDFESNGPNYPTGECNATPDVRAALTFASMDEARVFINRQSKTCPLRPDGQPNCPLRALTLVLLQVR